MPAEQDIDTGLTKEVAEAAAPVEVPGNGEAGAPVMESVAEAAPKPRRGRKPRMAAVAAPAIENPVVEKPAAKPVAAKARKTAKAKAAPKPRPAIAAKVRPVATAKAVAPKLVAPLQPKPRAKKIPVSRMKAAIKTAATNNTVPPKFSLFSQFEELKMDLNPNFTEGFKSAVTDAQDKAKAAFEKSTAMFGEVTEFTKGNVEAMVESGKILSAGLQDLGSKMAAESKTAFEAASADLKELASAKTPTDFFAMQSELAKKNFDGMVSYSSKSSEALLKLVGDVFAPISGRVSMAVEKVKSTAL